MLSEHHADELLSVLSRIAHSLERLAGVVDSEDNEFNVYVRGEVHLEENEDEEEGEEMEVEVEWEEE